MITLLSASFLSPCSASCVKKLYNICDIIRSVSGAFYCAIANPHTNTQIMKKKKKKIT